MTANPTALREAIARLERGEVGREVDALIARGLDLDGGQPWLAGSVPWSTTSIDAAVTLVPTECDWSMDNRPSAVVWERQCANMPRNSLGATPAAALCLAALRARLAMMEAS